MNAGYSICFNRWLLDKRIRQALPLLLMISSLSAQNGYCYASNKYLAEKLECTKQTITNHLSILRDCGYIEIKGVKQGSALMKREIFLRDLMAFNGNVKPRKPQKNTEQKAKENDLINETEQSLQENKPKNNTSQENNTTQTEAVCEYIDDVEIIETDEADETNQTSLDSFTLKKEMEFEKTTPEYKQRLKEFIKQKINNNPKFMSEDEFFNALLLKSYKYKNYARAYIAWNAKRGVKTIKEQTTKKDEARFEKFKKFCIDTQRYPEELLRDDGFLRVEFNIFEIERKEKNKNE